MLSYTDVHLRLCRLLCGKPLAFRTPVKLRRGFASRGGAAKRVVGLTESQRLSARKAAQPHKPLQVRYTLPCCGTDFN